MIDMAITRTLTRARTELRGNSVKVTSREGLDKVAQKNRQAWLPRQYRWWLLAAAVLRAERHGMAWR